MVRDAVARGELIEVLPDWDCEPLPLYIVYPQTRHLSNKVRVFVDWLARLVQTLKAEEQRAQIRRAS
ncbi:LysR substrate binding domain [Mycobacterium tuberculosis]|nr:LysR substrate binding domain [Mycobacterium tuberculosis]